MHTLVFIGDSITDADHGTDPEGLGDGYVRRVARYCGESAWVLNRGVSGDRVTDLQKRWDADALAERPWLLSVYVGINDVWRRFDSDDPTSAEDFGGIYRDLLDRARRAGVERFVLMEPFVLPVEPAQSRWLDDLAEKQAVVHRLASAPDSVLVALQEPLRAAADRLGPAAVASDGVHPSEEGTRLIAAAWLDRVARAGWI